jgi:hypothetical protein
MGKFKVVSAVSPVPSDFARLEKIVARGWRKFNEDGRWSNMGSSPYVDLYWGVRLLDDRFPVHESLSAVFCELARTIAEMYPERVRMPIESSYDARFVVMEFNDHPLTTHTDVPRVIRAAGGQKRG